jgi:hypothetical protein
MATHVYSAAGTDPVTLTVTDALGSTATASLDVVVLEQPAASLRRVSVEAHSRRLGEAQTISSVVRATGSAIEA